MRVLALAAGIGFAIVAAALAMHILVNGRVFVPGTAIWNRGYVGGVGAYAMDFSWLCLGASAVFASLMYFDRRGYFEHRHKRDVSFVGFGAFLLIGVIGMIVERANVGAF